MVNEKLRAAREARGMTQAEVSDAIGYQYASSYTNVERGNQRPSGRAAWELFRLFGISPVELREGGSLDA